MDALAKKRGWGLSGRIVALSLALLLIVQIAVYVAVGVGIEQSARQQISAELQVDERVWLRLIDQNAQKLGQAAAVLAADFGFRSAVSSGDVETMRSVLDNHGARIGASVTGLLDSEMRLQAVGEKQDLTLLKSIAAQIALPLSRNGANSQVALLGEVPFQFVLVPVRAPVLVGWVLMGFPVGQALLGDMRALSGVHVVLLTQAKGQSPRLIESSLSAQGAQQIEAWQSRSGGGQPWPSDVLLEGKSQVSHLVRIPTLSADGGGTELQALLLRSFDEVIAPFRKAQIALAWITFLGLILFGFGSVLMARRVTTPLRDLVLASQELGRGDYKTPLRHTGRTDEIGDLAIAFDQMRESIGNQQDEIRKLAFQDRLTGLPNRVRFREGVQTAIRGMGLTTGGERSLAVLVLDLDRFKVINDALGYAFGDSVLEAVGKRLMGLNLQAEDLVARLGGNEFAILLSNAGAEQALGQARAVAAAFEAPLEFADQAIDLSAAIGIACWPLDAADADTLLSHAEVAMYSAKRRTTGIQLYDPTLDSGSSQTLSLLSELRHALEHGELRLYLQPKITQLQSSPNAAEALVRWQHPVRGLLPPMAFVPFAEQTGFVRQLTLWVFNEAATLWHGLQAGGMPFQVAVNLSTRDLLDIEFPSRLDTILQRHSVPASGLCLEITESAIMDDPQRALVTLNRLHERGFKLSIDDFGTGYSSLAYLKQLPVDQLKIDKSFVLAIEKVKGDAMIVRSTIDLAHNLGLSVVAEGVENAATYHALKKLGCDEAQGYFIAKPMPAEAFAAWRTDWNKRLDENRRNFGQSIPMPLA